MVTTRADREAAARREAMEACRHHKVDFRTNMQAIIRDRQVRGFLVMDRGGEEVLERIWI